MRADHTAGDDLAIEVTLRNKGTVPALAAKLTLVDATGRRILPAFYSDNYVSLMPGDTHIIEIHCAPAHTANAQINLRGWNIAPHSTGIESAR